MEKKVLMEQLPIFVCRHICATVILESVRIKRV